MFFHLVRSTTPLLLRQMVGEGEDEIWQTGLVYIADDPYALAILGVGAVYEVRKRS